VIAFVVTATLVFVLIAAGTSMVLGLLRGWVPAGLVDAVAGASIMGHFISITRGVIDLRDLIYFVSVMIAFLAANAIIVDLKKAD
jgi:ABC-2 type transport system permease protein